MRRRDDEHGGLGHRGLRVLRRSRLDGRHRLVDHSLIPYVVAIVLLYVCIIVLLALSD
jgi:hypothetical protein